MPKISIIVPVYNTSKYIKRLVNSITSQDFQDFELLLIDDGSTDNSLSVCNECATSDRRIIVVHKVNSGVSSTRNLGIEISTGEWLWFIDSDDFIPKHALKIFADAISEDVDIIRGGLIKEKDGNIVTTCVDHDFDLVDKEQIICFYHITGYSAYLCNSLFRRGIIGVNRLDTSISWCEDHLFHYGLLKNVRKVRFLKAPVYYYDAPSTSFTNFGTNLSSRYLDPSMIMRGAILERDVRMAYLPVGSIDGQKVVDKGFIFKAKFALIYAVIGNRYWEALSITHKYLHNDIRYLISNILHIKIAPIIRKIIRT